MNTDFLKNNSIAKIIAVITAIFLWLFVINDGFRVDFLDSRLDVTLVNLRPGVAIANDIEDVQVRVRAPLTDFGSLDASDFTATIDVEDLSLGTQEIPVKVVSDKPEVQVVDVVPRTISITLDPQVTEDKGIFVELQGEPGDEYAVGDISPSVDQVRVSGAASALSSFENVIARVDVSNAMTSQEKTVELIARGVDDAELDVLIEPRTIDVSVEIKRQADVKTVGVQVDTSGSLPSGFAVKNISVEPSVFSIKGDQEILRTISVIETEPINLAGITENTTVTKNLVMPDGVTLSGSEDVISVVNVEIEVERTIKTKIIDITAQPINAPSGLSVRIDPPRARLVLEGDEQSLAGATDTSIQVTVDLSGREASRFNLPVTESLVTLPDGVRIKNIETKQFSIIIE